VNTDQSLISLFTNASLLVKMVMLLLLTTSVISWTLIFQRLQLFAKARKSVDAFETTFWSGMELSKLFHKVAAQRHEVSGTESIFLAGFKEFIRLRKQTSIQPTAVMEGAQRAMRVAMSKEIERLEMHLPFLATVSSISPYIGLFGTVWGIMNSFRALGAVQQATLSMVAPGISEALVATAMGLFAAIPANIAFNQFSNRLQGIVNRYENFLEEFTSILHRQAHTLISSSHSSSSGSAASGTLMGSTTGSTTSAFATSSSLSHSSTHPEDELI
jgi:biopolymer transport protein TolQ